MKPTSLLSKELIEEALPLMVASGKWDWVARARALLAIPENPTWCNRVER